MYFSGQGVVRLKRNTQGRNRSELYRKLKEVLICISLGLSRAGGIKMKDSFSNNSKNISFYELCCLSELLLPYSPILV